MSMTQMMMLTSIGGNDYWMLTIAGETVNSVTRSIRPEGGLAIDSSDNIFVSTDSLIPNTPLPDLVDPQIFKINNKGELQFKKSIDVTQSSAGILVNALQPNSNSVGAVTIASNGNIYLTYRASPTAGLFQTNDQDVFVAVLDSTGDATYGVCGNIDYQVFDNFIACRSDDYLWQVTEHREASGSPVEIYLHFWEATSTAFSFRDLERLNDYSGRSVTAGGFAIDGSDNAIIAGNYEFNASNNDYYLHVQKFSGNSSANTISRVWDKHIYSSEPAKTRDFHTTYALAADSSDNIYIFASISFNSGANSYSLIKLNSSGTLQWAKSYGTSLGLANSMAVDSSGNIYGFTGPDLFKINSSGDLQWVRSLAVANSIAISRSSSFIKLDSQENLVLTFNAANSTTVNNTYVSTTRVIILPNDGSSTGTHGDLTYSAVTGTTLSNVNLTVADSPLTSSNDTGADGLYVTRTTADSDTTNTTSITNF